MQNTPTVKPVSTPSNAIMNPGTLYTPITDQSAQKRKEVRVATDAPPAAKRSRCDLPTRKLPNRGNFYSDLCFYAMSLIILISGPQNLFEICSCCRCKYTFTIS